MYKIFKRHGIPFTCISLYYLIICIFQVLRAAIMKQITRHWLNNESFVNTKWINLANGIYKMEKITMKIRNSYLFLKQDAKWEWHWKKKYSIYPLFFFLFTCITSCKHGLCTCTSFIWILLSMYPLTALSTQISSLDLTFTNYKTDN